ncbi:MAG: peroxide stress protein YaaA [Flavobacteriales bacterium]|nr:peroxide stress protein YaaA [Flavobacteriales bacterium]
MGSLLAVISPAKLLDDQIHYPHLDCTQPEFLNEAESIMKLMRKMDVAQLAKTLDASPAIAEETKKRIAAWKKPFTHEKAIPALLMFRGEVYRGMQATTFTEKELGFAQENLRILSGLYGVLRPLDLIMPYRLMMGTALKVSATKKNLYDFWREKITANLMQQLGTTGTLLNLASDEYFKVIDSKKLSHRIIHCEFKEKKGDRYVVTSTYAKLARGRMARFFVENGIRNPEELKAFREDHYAFDPKLSDIEHFVFTRG